MQDLSRSSWVDSCYEQSADRGRQKAYPRSRQRIYEESSDDLPRRHFRQERFRQPGYPGLLQEH